MHSIRQSKPERSPTPTQDLGASARPTPMTHARMDVPKQVDRSESMGHRLSAGSPGPAAPVQLKKQPSLRARVAQKFAQANRAGTQANLTARERRFAPELARSPRSGFTPELLRNAKAGLRPVTHHAVHPELGNIDVRRTPGQGVGAYMDLVGDARQSMHTLMSEPGGHRMMTELDARIGQNRGHLGDNTDVPIRSTRPTDGSNMNSPHVAPGLEQGYRFDGAPGTGWGSEVRYDPNQASANRFIGLGHEMVHAHRLAHGKGVGVPQLNQADNPLFTDPRSVGADVPAHQNVAFGSHIQNVVQHTNHLQEEFETVGMRPTPGGGFNPSENMLRGEHGRPLRTDYSGERPGRMDPSIADLDQHFDRRGIFDRLRGRPAPTPVRGMLDRYHR